MTAESSETGVENFVVQWQVRDETLERPPPSSLIIAASPSRQSVKTGAQKSSSAFICLTSRALPRPHNLQDNNPSLS